MNDWFDMTVDSAYIKREREKARQLRQTDWWRAKLQQGICHYCGKKTVLENLTMDHVVPLARGGRSVKSNCVPCCKECNNNKKTSLPAEKILESLFPGQ
jgi:5-methylcytosine-specific restriction endonuclease McrA